MKKKLLSLLLAFALVFTLAACGGDDGEDTADGDATEVTDDGAADDQTDEEDDGEDETADTGDKVFIRTNNSSEPGSLDPAEAQGTHESWILAHCFEGLMKYDENGELVEGMADDMEVSEDGLTYTFTLKDDIQWSNGDEITAEDFEYSWKRVLDPEAAHDYAHQLFYLKNGEAYLTGEAEADDVGVKALDEKTLEVTLEAPVTYFPDLTAFFTLYPVSKNADEENPDWAKSAETYVSNGPFVLTEWSPNSKIILEKNENYYDADNVKIDGIDLDVIEEASTAFEKYEAGEYDILVDVPTQVVAEKLEQDDADLEIGNMAGVYYYNLNTENPIFANAKVRQAMSMSLDRDIIVEKIAQGGELPAEGVVPYGLPDPDGKEFRDYNGNLVEEDNEKAKELLKEGLEEEGLTIDDLQSAVLLYNTSEAHQKIAEAVQEMWRQNLDIEIGLENVDFQVKLDREKAGDYDISRAGWIGDYADPMTMIELWHSEGAFNDANYNNPEYDALVEEVKASNDQELRFNKMAEAEKIVMEDMPVIPVYFYTQPYLVHENVSGIYKALLEYPTLTYAEVD